MKLLGSVAGVLFALLLAAETIAWLSLTARFSNADFALIWLVATLLAIVIWAVGLRRRRALRTFLVAVANVVAGLSLMGGIILLGATF